MLAEPKLELPVPGSPNIITKKCQGNLVKFITWETSQVETYGKRNELTHTLWLTVQDTYIHHGFLFLKNYGREYNG